VAFNFLFSAIQLFFSIHEMSKSKKKQDKPAVAGTAAEVDPQTLFQQFAPALHFTEPKRSTKAEWFIIAEQVVPVAREYFWETIVNISYTTYITTS
jgi:hypothetical protein